MRKRSIWRSCINRRILLGIRKLVMESPEEKAEVGGIVMLFRNRGSGINNSIFSVNEDIDLMSKMYYGYSDLAEVAND
jgi:hypothetical protein